MRTPIPRSRSLAACVALSALAVVLLPRVRAACAAEETATVEDVENARRCAAATRTVGHAFAEVRDSVRAGGTTRAGALLDDAEAALRDARTVCAGDRDVSAQLDLLAADAATLRRALPSSRR